MTDEQPTSRSDAARARILAAAKAQFVDRGYDRATVRSIAAAAEIDPSMVIRYFGSKEELFAASVGVRLQLPDLTRLPRAELGARLARHFVDRWEQDPALVALLRRTAADPQIKAIHQVFGTQIAPMVASVTEDPAEVAPRAGLIATQILGLALCRFVLKLPPAVDFTADQIVSWCGPTLQRYLAEPLPKTS